MTERAVFDDVVDYWWRGCSIQKATLDLSKATLDDWLRLFNHPRIGFEAFFDAIESGVKVFVGSLVLQSMRADGSRKGNIVESRAEWRTCIRLLPKSNLHKWYSFTVMEYFGNHEMVGVPSCLLNLANALSRYGWFDLRIQSKGTPRTATILSAVNATFLSPTWRVTRLSVAGGQIPDSSNWETFKKCESLCLVDVSCSSNSWKKLADVIKNNTYLEAITLAIPFGGRHHAEDQGLAAVTTAMKVTTSIRTLNIVTHTMPVEDLDKLAKAVASNKVTCDVAICQVRNRFDYEDRQLTKGMMHDIHSSQRILSDLLQSSTLRCVRVGTAIAFEPEGEQKIAQPLINRMRQHLRDFQVTCSVRVSYFRTDERRSETADDGNFRGITVDFEDTTSLKKQKLDSCDMSMTRYSKFSELLSNITSKHSRGSPTTPFNMDMEVSDWELLPCHKDFSALGFFKGITARKRHIRIGALRLGRPLDSQQVPCVRFSFVRVGEKDPDDLYAWTEDEEWSASDCGFHFAALLNMLNRLKFQRIAVDSVGSNDPPFSTLVSDRSICGVDVAALDRMFTWKPGKHNHLIDGIVSSFFRSKLSAEHLEAHCRLPAEVPSMRLFSFDSISLDDVEIGWDGLLDSIRHTSMRHLAVNACLRDDAALQSSWDSLVDALKDNKTLYHLHLETSIKLTLEKLTALVDALRGHPCLTFLEISAMESAQQFQGLEWKVLVRRLNNEIPSLERVKVNGKLWYRNL